MRYSASLTATCRIRALAALAVAATAIAAFGAGTADASPTCTIYWTGKTNTNWSTATNWSLIDGGGSAGHVPGASDYVCMSTSPTNATPTIASTGNVTVEGIDWGEAGAVQPNLTVSGKLTLGDSTAVDASTIYQLSVTGTLVSHKEEAITATDLTLDGTLEGPGKLTVTGPATLDNTGTVFLGEYGTSGTQADLVLQGATTVSGTGNVYFSDGSEIENQGTLTLENEAYLYNYDGNTANKLVNDSKATVSFDGTSSSESATVEVAAVNNGTVSVVGEGTLSFGGGTGSGADSGAFTAAAGTTLDLGGTRTEASGATIGGAGEVAITGTAMFTAAANLTSTGTFEVSGALAVASGVNLNTNNLTLDGTLEGPGKLTVSGPATLGNTGNVFLGGYPVSGTQADLVLQGATTVSGYGYVYFSEGSEIENQGTLTLQDEAYLENYDGDAANEMVNDHGATVSFTGSSSSESAIVEVPAVNNGTVSVGKGTLSFGGGTGSGADSGAFTAAAGTTLDLGGTRTEASGATIGGKGEVDITGTTAFTAATNLTSTGTFEVNGTLRIASGVNVSTSNLTLDGTLEGPGKLTVTGPATVGNTGSVFLGQYETSGTQADLVLQGATTVDGGTYVYFAAGSEIENKGTLTLQDEAYLYNYDGTKNNRLVNDSGGTVSYTGSTTSQSASIEVAASNGGTVSANKGTLYFGGGSGSVSDSGAFNAAAGATLDVAGTRTENSGATFGGAGKIDVGGNVTFTAASNLTNTGTFEVGGVVTVASGVTVTSPNLTLDGTLRGPGTLKVSGPATVENAYLGEYEAPKYAAHLVLQGETTVVASSGTYFNGGSVLENEGTLTLHDEAYLYNYDGNTANELVNDSGGTVSYTGSTTSQTAYIEVVTANDGTVDANKGILGLLDLSNLSSAGTLTGGTYNAAGGTLSLARSVTTNAATISLGATPSKILTGGTNALSTLASNSGSLTLNQSSSTSASFSNSGSVTVQSGTFSTHSFTQTAGTTTVVGGATLQSNSGAGNVAINGGMLTGTGQIKGNLLGTANVVPIGAAAGPMTVTGSYTDSAGTLRIPVSGTSTAGTEYGQLSATGAVTLGGTLTFATAEGYLPPIGTEYTIVKAATVTGTFATVNGSQLPNRQYMLSYTPTSVTATVTAIPPAVTKVEPVEGPTVGGTSVTITGTELIDATGVSFGSTAATSYTVDSATQITATAPAGSAGTVDVTVSTPGGTSSANPGDHYTYVPEPSVAKVEPNQGPLVGGTSVTITGTNFTGAKEVKFGSVPAKGFTVNSATSITAETPAGSAGTVNVTVTTIGGESAASGADDFTYVAPPTVTKVAPHEGPLGGSTKVTITGANLLGATAVKFGSAAAKSFTVVSGTSITAESPAGSAGTVNIVVTTPGGESAVSGADDFTYVAAPTVTKVEPAEGPAAGGTKVTITGTRFTGAKEVKFGSVAAKSFTVVSGTSITAESPAGSAGTVNVAVTTVGGKSAVSGADDFTYVAAPTVTKVEPAEGPAAGGTKVTITGTNFTGAKEVKFGSVAATGVTVNTATSITAEAPAGSGTVDVTVATVGGTSATGSTDQYTYVPVPTVTKVEPSEGPVAGGTSVTITGTNLTGATGVSFGSTAATSFTVNSSTQITASAPGGTGTVDATVTTVGGTSAPNPPSDQYTYVPEPTVTGLSPTKGPTVGGTTVTITGTNLSGATAVKFGSVAAKSFTVVSGTSITAVSPAGTGIVNVTVTTVGGESATSSADEFGYGAVAPSVTAVEPHEGPTTGATTVTITGTSFTGAKEVKFGSVVAKGFTVNSATSITAESPAGSAGTVNVVVTTVGGKSAVSSADDFTYVAAPTVTKVAPVEGPVAGGTKVTITGTHFTGAKEVKFGSVAATSVVVVSAGSITATAPAGAAGAVDVTVTTVGGTSALSSADQYTYVPLPTVTKVEPVEGPVAGGTKVTITGTNFTGAKEVKFGSVVAKGFTVVSATSITVESPAEVSAATVNVVVTTVGGKSAVSSADDFTYVAAPTVTKVAPVEGPVAGGTKVTITGTHFTGAKEVKFGSVSATNVVVVSSTSITATAPAGTAGPVDVTVTTVGGTSATSGADHYTYIPAPSVTKVEPHEGPTTGATTVTITGTSFAGAKEVKFGSVVAKSFTVDSATSITAESPAGSAGTVNVVVTTVGGKSAVSSADDFTYVAAPTVTKVAPVEGPVAGGTKVTITGTHFTGAKEVKFGSVSATNVVVVSSTSITATAPAGATGPVNVTVTTVGGTSALSSADEYTYV